MVTNFIIFTNAISESRGYPTLASTDSQLLLRLVPLCLQRTVERQAEATCRASLVGRDAHAPAVVQPVGFLTCNDDLDHLRLNKNETFTMPPCLKQLGETWTQRRFELPRLCISHTIPAGDHSRTSRFFFSVFPVKPKVIQKQNRRLLSLNVAVFCLYENVSKNRPVRPCEFRLTSLASTELGKDMVDSDPCCPEIPRKTLQTSDCQLRKLFQAVCRTNTKASCLTHIRDLDLGKG